MFPSLAWTNTVIYIIIDPIKEGLECYGASGKKKKTCPETIMYLKTSTVQGESEGFHWFQVELKQVKPSSLYHNVIIIINIDHLQATFKYNLWNHGLFFFATDNCIVIGFRGHWFLYSSFSQIQSQVFWKSMIPSRKVNNQTSLWLNQLGGEM